MNTILVSRKQFLGGAFAAFGGCMLPPDFFGTGKRIYLRSSNSHLRTATDSAI